MLISKRELLDETGISYGQLYRWKREGLIPEEWFIKQSAFTGQETFFPRELILKRIKAIQDLKDKYTLEEVAKLLSPEVPSKGFAFNDLESINEISKEILYALKSDIEEDNVLYIHVLMLIIMTAIKEELNLFTSQVVELYEGIRPHIKDVKSTNYIYKVFEIDKKYYSVLYQEDSNFYLDDRFAPIKNIRIEDVSNEFKIKYKTQFDYFMADSEEERKENKQQNNKFDESETIKISLDDIEIISKKNSNNSKNSDNHHYSNQSNNNKQENKKSRDDDKIVLKFNNWEVRL
jgi:DNA-binding transcriptional MerR regulator